MGEGNIHNFSIDILPEYHSFHPTYSERFGKLENGWPDACAVPSCNGGDNGVPSQICREAQQGDWGDAVLLKVKCSDFGSYLFWW